MIWIEDNGQGLEPELIPAVFEPFVQGNSSLDRGSGGLGLGLAVVKLLVELHGGQVAAYSEGRGKGARFIVRLPLLQPEARTHADEYGAVCKHGKRRVVVIEDNVDLADALKELLESRGHTVFVSHNGPDGIAKAARYRPHVILCDIGLPGMDGYQVAQTLRAEHDLKATLLVSLTGYAQLEDRERALEAGFDRHLAKPVSLETLMEVLAEA